jgi:hypothetical protein
MRSGIGGAPGRRPAVKKTLKKHTENNRKRQPEARQGALFAGPIDQGARFSILARLTLLF